MANYMVLYINVDNGEIEEVYGADDTPKDLEKAKLEEAERVPDENLDPKIFKKPKASTTFYAKSSPGCRYVHRSDCWYYRVCR